MSPDDLAAELLDAVLEADPLTGSLYGLPGYDARLPDFGRGAEDRFASTVGSIADRAGTLPVDGLGETEHQSLDFVRHMARAMAGAAEVPLVEFTICDTFAAPVGAVLTMLPKVPLDTEQRRDDYLTRLAGLGPMLATAAGRHREGTAAGRTAVARLVRSAIAQLDLLVSDPSAGGLTRPDQDDGAFGPAARSAVDDQVRPALVAYRDALRDDVLPAARDDDRPGICFLPDGESMYRVLSRFHSSSDATADELHDLGREIVEDVRTELVRTGGRLFGTSDLREIFDRLANDPAQRYGDRQEMLDHARRVVSSAEAAAPAWFSTVPDEPCTVEPVSEAEEAGSPPAYYMTGAVDGSRPGTYFLNTSEPGERHRYMAEDMAFHEAVPGHHFQLTIARESRTCPPPVACSWTRPAPRDGASTANAWPTRWVSTATTPPVWACSPPTPGGPAGWSSTPVCTPGDGPGARRWSGWPSTPRCPRSRSMRRSTVTSPIRARRCRTWWAGGRSSGSAPVSRDALGDTFDIKEFHDVILRAGIMPLAALAGTVERWVARTGG